MRDDFRRSGDAGGFVQQDDVAGQGQGDLGRDEGDEQLRLAPHCVGPDIHIGLEGYGPNMNIVRDPRFGRNCEIPSEDPLSWQDRTPRSTSGVARTALTRATRR